MCLATRRKYKLEAYATLGASDVTMGVSTLA